MDRKDTLPSSDKKGLIIHHWDTDGICSAAILFESFGNNMDSWIPQIGNYYLTSEEIAELSIKGYNFIILADMAMPADNILKLKRESNASICIFDHHLQNLIEGINHYNPISMGQPTEKFPSNTWVLSDYLNREIDLLSILGVIGDNEQKIKNNRDVFSIIETYLGNSNLTFDDLLTMVELIDSNYKEGSREMVLDAVFFVKENRLAPELLLKKKSWHKNLKKLRREIIYQSNMPVSSIDSISIQQINTKYNIISTLTRQLAQNSGSKVSIVINRGYFSTMDQVYIRASDSKVFLKPIIDFACKNGYSAGGKNEVVGVVLPKENTDNFINKVRNRLNRLVLGLKP